MNNVIDYNQQEMNPDQENNFPLQMEFNNDFRRAYVEEFVNINETNIDRLNEREDGSFNDNTSPYYCNDNDCINSEGNNCNNNYNTDENDSDYNDDNDVVNDNRYNHNYYVNWDTMNEEQSVPIQVQQQSPYSIDVLVQTLLIMATKIKRNLSYTDSNTIMKLLNTNSNSNSTHSSKYMWKKILHEYSHCLTIHHFCKRCCRHVGPQRTLTKEEDELHCDCCGLNFRVKRNLEQGNIFIYLSLKEQLMHILENYHDSILDPADRPDSLAVRDIYDGELYKKSFNDNMISINFSLDGAPIFKSSNNLIYPLLCSLNELSPINRRKNIMLVSLWFGKGKMKSINEYLKPFVDECRKLHETGFTYMYGGKNFTKRCRVWNCICDSVQRPVMRGSTQFNGKYGCGLCLHPGERVEKGNGHVRVYRVLKKHNLFGDGSRDHKNTLEHIKRQKKGMKEESLLCEIPNFDIIKNIDVDWMHCVALGVCRQFSDLWFNSKCKNEKFYHGKLLKKIDKTLKSYKPSLETSRTPREMSDRVHWKAHEWVVWLWFYSIPTLKPLFPKNLVKHWSLLVEAVTVLCKRSIDSAEIHQAETLLFMFIEKTEMLYGIEHMTFNVHLLAHLAQSVWNWGPLHTHSAFIYEDFNQILKHHVKSVNGVAIQVCDTVRTKMAVQNLERECDKNLSKQWRISG